MTRAELIEALETAQGANRGLFVEAFDCCHPAPCGDVGAPVPNAYYAWLRVKDRFCHLLNTDAYLDAAMMLLPVGWRIYTADFSVKGRFRWMLEGPKTLWETDENVDRCGGADWYSQGIAATPALALAAACLRAGGE